MAKRFLVNVAVENKPSARDPEGETIQKELIWRGGYTSVRSVRVAKLLMMIVESDSGGEAEKLAARLCNDLRIFNPAVHSISVELKGEVPS